VDWWLAALMGVVQGLTEFLPISSSAHLRIVPALFGQNDPGASFTAIIQLGTILSVLIFFAKDLFNILRALLRGLTRRSARDNKDFRLGISIALATVPIVIVGLLAQDFISTNARNLYVVAYAMLIFSFVMYFVDRYSKANKNIEQLNRKQIFFIGIAQSFALIPGFSRSGVTITAARFLGISRSDAARFSFLLSVPAIVLAGIYEAFGVAADNQSGWGQTILATIISFIVGYLSISWLIKWLSTHSLRSFVIYRIGLALVIIGLLNSGIITAL